jgi:hypothetical protein
MKYKILFCIFILVSFLGHSQVNPQSKSLTERYFPDADTIKDVTPALQKKRGFTDYKELIAFLEQLKNAHPKVVNLSYIGTSQKGYEIPLIHLSKKDIQGEKIKVWLQGGLHGNEPASTEGVLYLLYEILNNPQLIYLIDRLEIAAVPMANIDGYLKQNRYAADGLDLNRDQTKLMAPESVFLKKTFSNYNAEVAIDFHEYNPFRKDFSKLGSFGVMSVYDIMFLKSGNLNVPSNMRNLTDSLFVGNTKVVLDRYQLRHHDYVSTSKYRNAIHFNQGSNSSRSSATSYALTNAVSSLIEVRGVHLDRTSFKRRIATTYLVGMSYLQTAYNNVALIKDHIKKAQIPQDTLSVTSTRTVYDGALSFIDIDTKDLIDLDVTIRDALQMQPVLSRPVPHAYLINKDHTFLIDKLKTLGLKIKQLDKETAFNIEAYQVTEYERETVRYEKMNLQKIATTLEQKSMTFPVGTFIIHTDQKNSPLLAEVLEPEAPSSFVSFGVLETNLNEELPIYRLPKTN